MNHGHYDQHWNFGGGAGPDQSCWGKDSHHDDQHWHSGGWAAPAPCAPTPDAWENDQHCHQELEVKFYDQCEHQPVDHCAGFDGHDVVLLGLGC